VAYFFDEQFRDSAKIEKIVNTLKLKVQPRDLKIKDGKLLVNILMSQWLPLSNAVLRTG